MNYDPVISFARQRISDLGGNVMANTSQANALVRGMADSDKRACAELLIIISLCEGLNKMQEMIQPNETKHS